MGCPSHMDLLEQDNTSGPSLLCLVLVWAGQSLPPTWEMTTSVRVGILGHHGLMWSMQVTHSGMDRAVDPLLAVNWTNHLGWLPPGSASSCPRPQLMILKLVFVGMKGLQMKILQLNLLNFTSAELCCCVNTNYNLFLRLFAYSCRLNWVQMKL